ncbi:GNAT family N-acetyltransferase [Streptomyces sp. NPDC048606]|uniref:GNAT family N-acetyltransferase n=1 Tax=Streptomyces sp. NPDC048606 TaxID=3154726 RepID=UPI003439FA24
MPVHPDSAGQGIGRSLLDHPAERAAARSVPALALTMFAAVPWSAPCYARCGFQVLDDDLLSPGRRTSVRLSRSWRGRVAAVVHASRSVTVPVACRPAASALRI